MNTASWGEGSGRGGAGGSGGASEVPLRWLEGPSLDIVTALALPLEFWCVGMCIFQKCVFWVSGCSCILKLKI